MTEQINWYVKNDPGMGRHKDLILGRVVFGKTYRGIGSDAFLDCSVRDIALKKCNEVKK